MIFGFGIVVGDEERPRLLYLSVGLGSVCTSSVCLGGWREVCAILGGGERD